ncbi:G-PROTEIN-RECEP-F1-2 domain-containing protein [Aphelenchoides fujianensis]|nr:G-PROTEIN-RECEP-F1-2 domain-containing protein [Aphelenchoides fujianensis]
MENITDLDKATTPAEYMFAKYHGKGPQVELYLPALFLFLVMWCGYFGNGLVVLATWKNRALHGTCNLFLALSCLGDIMHQSAHWAFAYVTVSGINFIPYRHCLYADTIPQVGCTLTICMTFFVGLDRLFSVLLPAHYRQVNTRIYAGICIGITALIAAYGLYCSYSFAFGAGKDVLVSCIIIDSMSPSFAQQWFLLCVVLNLLDIFVYSACWYLIQHRTGNNESMKRVFRSLLAIMFSVAFGWLVNALVMGLIVPVAGVPISQVNYFTTFFGFLPNIASATNVIPLYIFSQEYRQTIRSLLAPIFPSLRVSVQKVHVLENTKSAITFA